MPTTPASPMVDLSAEECVALLRRGGVGRVAAPDPSGPPEVAPVNFVFDGGAVVFRSDLGTKLQLLRAGIATFEVDEVDVVNGRAWSVVVKGRTYEPSHWETDFLRVEPMADGPKRHWVRLVPSSITGRRIGNVPEEDR